MTLVSTVPASATTRETEYYTLVDENVTFTLKQRLSYVQYSSYLDVSWTDLYIKVLSCCGSTGRKLHCVYCQFQRSWDYPPGGFVQDDNSPSTFQYENTPAWANVYLSPTGNFYWGSGVVQFDDRASAVAGFCDQIGWGFVGEMAGVRLYYSPSVGWHEASYSSP
jgi:hypothetical protein